MAIGRYISKNTNINGSTKSFTGSFTGTTGINGYALLTPNGGISTTAVVCRAADATYNPNGIEIYTNGLERIRVNSAGQVGIGAAPSGSAKLIVNGKLYATDGVNQTGMVVCSTNSSVGGAVRASGYIQWSTDAGAVGTNYFASDIRKKENIQPANFNSSSLINQIEFISFDWKPDSGNVGSVNVGVSAQQLQTLDDRLVHELTDGSLMVNEPALVAHMAKAIQEQQEMIIKLTERIDSLTNTSN